MKPRIDREGMKSITIKAGRTHKWTVDVSGEPPPTLTWILKDNEVTNSDRIKIENIDYQTNITIINAQRKDTGKYTLVAKNASGKDEASLEFTVLGKNYFPSWFTRLRFLKILHFVFTVPSYEYMQFLNKRTSFFQII